jgi:prephenate dehydrogenase
MSSISRKTVILGAGLLGGSVGLAMRKRELADAIHVWSPSPSTRASCEEADWCDVVHEDPLEACNEADLVVLCAPVDKIPALMEEIAPVCGEGCLITDVGSTKASIAAMGNRLFPAQAPASFIGSHPMAGSEKSGLSFADADLFSDKTCILTPTSDAVSGILRLRSFWESLGMVLFECPPDEHDQIVAHVSHLPHAVAAILCLSLSKAPENWIRCAGAGLRDTTRIAGGDPQLWAAIFRANEHAVRDALDHMKQSLATWEASLDAPGDTELLSFLETARSFRSRLETENGRHPPNARLP